MKQQTPVRLTRNKIRELKGETHQQHKKYTEQDEIEEEDEPIESRRVFDENTFGFNLGLSNDILNAAPAIGPGSAGFSSLNSDEDVTKEEEILDEDKKNDDKNAEVKKPRLEVLATIAKQERMQKQKFKVVDCVILTLDSSSSEEEQEEEKEKEQQEQQPQQQQRAQKPHAFVAKKKKTISFASAADAAALQAENEEAEKKRWKQKQIERTGFCHPMRRALV